MLKKFASYLLLSASLVLSGQSQTVTNLIDAFNPAGVGGNSYSGGHIGNVWANWFGGAFQSLAWDVTSDANNNAASGSLKITANFTASQNQYEVFDGYSGISPALNGLQYTNFQCDVRFDPSSATTTNGNVVSFGHLQFGIQTNGTGQDYFGSIDVPSSHTGWVHVSIPINAVADIGLTQINDVLIHIYGPTYGSGLIGTSILWVDNIQFTGSVAHTVGACSIDWNTVYQRIDGFGASSAWNGSWSSTQADLFFSTNSGTTKSYDGKTNFVFNGIGLSLLRSRIAPGGTTVENTIMQMAQARGARVWSTPWSPQPSFKNTNSVNGGAFVGSVPNYQGYASQLAGYVAKMKSTYGINLYAISIQNEPDVNTTGYESCTWTAQQFHDFAPYLSSALVSSNVAATKIILSEDEHWATTYYSAAMSDASVATNIGIIACHNYDGAPPAGLPAALSKYSNTNAALWETEVSLLTGSDSSITNAVYWAGRVHSFLTIASANAWHYWWLTPGNSVGNQGLVDTNGVPAKRFYALGNFSRFVRPNFYRINVANSGSIQISAYKDSVSPSFAIVAINSGLTSFTQTFNLTNIVGVSALTPWITSSNLSLSNQTAVAAINQSFTYTLPAMSIVTFTGLATNNVPPMLSAVPSQTINAGVSLAITNVATDTSQPTPTLTFALLAAPTNASLNPASGVFNWRPLVSQANTTNTITVMVADNNVPSLSATNSFTVRVNPISQPTISSAKFIGGQFSFMIHGTSGPDYSLLVSTNLLDWQVLLTSNSLALPCTLVDTNRLPARFYRIQIGP